MLKILKRTTANFVIMRSLSFDCSKTKMRNIFAKSINSVYPTYLIRKSVELANDTLHIDGKQYKLNNNCFIVGFGKAVVGMASELERMINKHLIDGIVSVPEGIKSTLHHKKDMFPMPGSVLKVFEGAKNNLPDKNAEETAKKIQKLAKSVSEGDILIVLISGGGSALLPLPCSSVTLEEKLMVIKLLASAGANILELNCVRKRLSELKGGGLAKSAFPANIISLILSDVVGDPIDIIASGPTVPNCDHSDAALSVIKKYSLEKNIPTNVLNFLSNIPNEEPEHFKHVQNVIIGNNEIAINQVKRDCQEEGFIPVILSSKIQGNITSVAEMYANLALNICQAITTKSTGKLLTWIDEISKKYDFSENVSRDITEKIALAGNKDFSFIIISGGETTVNVRGNGIGGRNQELALTFAKHMFQLEENHCFLKHFYIALLSAGTDGIDGPTNAAGAIGYGEQFSSTTLNPLDYLNNNDTYNFYEKYNNGLDLIKTGHTGTNVMDIHMLLVQSRPSTQ